MTKLSDFFKGSDTSLGVFYPNHYLVAVFPDLKAAGRVFTRLRFDGFASDQVIAGVLTARMHELM